MMGAKGGDLKPHGHCHRTRGYKPSRVPRCRDQVRILFPARSRHSYVARERGAGIYTPCYIRSLSCHRYRSMRTSAFLHAIYSRCVYDLGSRIGTSVIFHRFVRARVRPCRHFKSRADFQPACERR